MKKMMLIAAAIGMVSFGVGCDEEPAAPVTPPQATEQQAPAQGKSIQEQAKDLAAEGKQAVTAAIDEAKPQIQAAATQVKEEVQQIAFDYKKKLDEAAQYLKEKKIDLADKALAEVEAHKDSIPAAMHERIASLRKMIDTAKQAQGLGVSLPKF